MIKEFVNETFGKLNVVFKDGELIFIGKEVAEALGYADYRDALKKHVDKEDRFFIKKSELSNRGVAPSLEIPNRGLSCINESGLYSLIIASKLPSAKKFKDWITKVVLPSIRQNGGYIEGQEALVGEELEKVKAEIKTLRKTVADLRTKNRNLMELLDEKENEIWDLHERAVIGDVIHQRLSEMDPDDFLALEY